MTDPSRFIYLLKCYLEHTCSGEQLQEFATLISRLDDNTLSDLVADNWSHHVAVNKLDDKEATAILDDILKTKSKSDWSADLASNQLAKESSTQTTDDIVEKRINQLRDRYQGQDLANTPKPDQVMEMAPKGEADNIATVNKYLPINAKRKKSSKLYRVAAAIIGFLILLGAFWQFHSFRQDKTKQLITEANTAQSPKADIAPGTSGAILTLASGKQVILDSLTAKGGQQLLAGTAGAIVELKPGGIEYTGHGASANGPVKYNTLATPASRTFHVKLPDGTEVWLNAASSIRYPVAFNKNQREVTITGEAYFEVAKLQRTDGKGRVPFIVDIQTDRPSKSPSRVEVLGTHFNINAYADQGEIKTTLLEGRVNVYAAASNKATAIVPGDQAVMGTSFNSPVSVHTTDIQKAVAWKNGYFDFNQASLKEVMQQIGRWYNVEIVYAGNVPERKFWGKIQRSLYLTQVLSVLEQVDIHFKIEKNKLIVMP